MDIAGASPGKTTEECGGSNSTRGEANLKRVLVAPRPSLGHMDMRRIDPGGLPDRLDGALLVNFFRV